VEGIIEAGPGEGEGMQCPMGDGQRIGIVPAGLFRLRSTDSFGVRDGTVS
jgi:hypothetical protein